MADYYDIETGLSSASPTSYNAKGICRGSDGRIHCAYDDNGTIKHAYSDDNMSTWTVSSTGITTTGTGNKYVAMCVDSNDDLFIAFTDNISGGQDKIYVSKYDGTAWGARVLVWTATTTSATGFTAIAVDTGDDLYIVWHHNDAGSGQGYSIWWSKSTDGGSTWSTPAKVLTDTPNSVLVGTLGIDSSDNVHLCGYNTNSRKLYYTKYDGVSWSTKVTLYTDANALDGNTMIIDTSDNIHVIFRYSSDAKVGHLVSTDGGSTWSSITDIWGGGGNNESSLQLAVDEVDNVYAFARRIQAGNDDIVMKKSTDGGSTWSSETTFNSGSDDVYTLNALSCRIPTNNQQIPEEDEYALYYEDANTEVKALVSSSEILAESGLLLNL